MKEGHEALDAAAWRAIHELDALGCQAHERARKIVDNETKVVQRWAATLCDEARDAGIRIGRLEQLDSRAITRRESDPHALVGDGARLVNAVAEHVAIERDRFGERGHRDGDMMKLSGADAFHARGGW